MAGLLATDAEAAEREIPEYNDNLRNSWDDSLRLDESGWESLDDLYTTMVSSDDNAIVEYLLPAHKLSFSTGSTQRTEKKPAKHVQGKRTVAQEVELSESDLEPDPETCGKCVIVYLWL